MPEEKDFMFEIDPGSFAGEGFGLFEGPEGFMQRELSEDGLPIDDADVLFPDAMARNQYEPLDPEKVGSVEGVKQDSPEYAARPAEERTRELFAQMHPHRISLLGILNAAKQPISSTAMVDVAETLRKQKFNVYSANNLCTMLEVAGALDRVLEDGSSYGSYEPTPNVVVIDGEEYYEPTRPPQVFWQTSDAGQIMLDENDPYGRAQELFVRESDLLPIYKQVLQIAQAGASMATFSKKVDANPAIAEPRRFFVQHFVESLERCEALAWDGKQWVITPVGTHILEELLAFVEAAEEFEETGKSATSDGAAIPTETQGVYW